MSRLITFEGTEGAGKSTLLKGLSARLRTLKIPHLLTREPGGSELAEKIREILLHHEMSTRTELLLYLAARNEHFEHTILPALQRGELVLCDRFTDSSLAYQGSARGLPWKTIRSLNEFATQKYKPYLTFFLDLPPEVGLSRAQDPNRFEAEGLEFQKKVRRGYLRIHKEEPRRFVRIQTKDLSPEEVLEEVFTTFQKKVLR